MFNQSYYNWNLQYTRRIFFTEFYQFIKKSCPFTRNWNAFIFKYPRKKSLYIFGSSQKSAILNMAQFYAGSSSTYSLYACFQK